MFIDPYSPQMETVAFIKFNWQTELYTVLKGFHNTIIRVSIKFYDKDQVLIVLLFKYTNISFIIKKFILQFTVKFKNSNNILLQLTIYYLKWMLLLKWGT